MYWSHGMGGWGFPIMLLNMLVFWGVLIGGGLLVFRALRPSGSPSSGGDARRLLAERYARGEIDDEEYQRRLEMLLRR